MDGEINLLNLTSSAFQLDSFLFIKTWYYCVPREQIIIKETTL